MAGSGAIAWSPFSSGKKRALDNGFRLYLSGKYVEEHPYEVFKKKTELAVEILIDELTAYSGWIPRNRIALLLDAAYAVKRVLSPAREKGLIYVGRLKKDRWIRLFNRWMRVERYFMAYKNERYFTYEGLRVFYKEAVLEVKELGRARVFRLREEGEKEFKYYVSNKLDMTARTCYRYKKLRWKIEEMHRDEKQYLGLREHLRLEKGALAGSLQLCVLSVVALREVQG